MQRVCIGDLVTNLFTCFDIDRIITGAKLSQGIWKQLHYFGNGLYYSHIPLRNSCCTSVICYTMGVNPYTSSLISLPGYIRRGVSPIPEVDLMHYPNKPGLCGRTAVDPESLYL